MQALKLTFSIQTMPLYAVAHKDGRKTLEIQAFDGTLTVAVQYTWNRKPLEMNAEVQAGDQIEAILYEHRIELYVNGVIKDEEWPAGRRLYTAGDAFTPDVGVCAEEYEAEEAILPSVITTFEGAEGWMPGDGVFVGDCMPYLRDGEYHVLYLKDRHHHRSKWGMGAHQWEHISTKDFKTWSVHPMAVPVTSPEEGSICTGSWIRNGGTEYLYYTIRRGGGLPAIIARSISEDGYHFKKDTGFGFVLSDKYDTACARDPKVIKDGDGTYHMFLTTVLLSENRGCLAHYVSPDLEAWEECEDPLYVVENSDHPECPDYFVYGGKYYLVFSLRGRARYLVSDEPFSGFVMPEDPMIPCYGVPKCAEWEGRLVFTGFKPIGGYAGTMTFKAATAKENGELVFEDL